MFQLYISVGFCFKYCFGFLFKNHFTYLQKYVHTDEKAPELLLSVTMMGTRNILSSVAIIKMLKIISNLSIQ